MTPIAIPAPSVVAARDLRVGDVLAEGGEGTVHQLPRQPHLVYKSYRRRADRSHLEALVAWPDQLPTDLLRQMVRAASAWPCSVVAGPGGEAVGMLMPRAPRRFALRHRDGHSRLASLSYLTSDPEHRALAYGLALPPAVSPERIGLVYALARLLAGLEAGLPMVGHGDLSTKNVLWSLQRGPEVFVIDCDSSERFSPDGAPLDGPGRRRAMTPNWDDPAVPRGSNPSVATDRYSLALIFLRVVGAANFPVQARQRSGDRLEIAFPVPTGRASEALLDPHAPVWGLCARALTLADPSRRPSAASWLGPLEALLDAMGAADLMRAVWAAQGGGLPSSSATSLDGPPPGDVVIRPERAPRRDRTWARVSPNPRYGAFPEQGRARAVGYRRVYVALPMASRPNPASAQPRAPGGAAPTWVRPSAGGTPPSGGPPGSGPPSPWMSGGASAPIWPEVRAVLVRLLHWWLSLHATAWGALRGRGSRSRGVRVVLFCGLVDFSVIVLAGAALALIASPILES